MAKLLRIRPVSSIISGSADPQRQAHTPRTARTRLLDFPRRRTHRRLPASSRTRAPQRQPRRPLDAHPYALSISAHISLSPLPGWMAVAEGANHCRMRRCSAAPRPTTPSSPSPPPSNAARRSPWPPPRSTVAHATAPALEVEYGSRGDRRLWCCVAIHWFLYSSAPIPLTSRPSSSTVMPLSCSTRKSSPPVQFHLLSHLPVPHLAPIPATVPSPLLNPRSGGDEVVLVGGGVLDGLGCGSSG
jgi:hypothetical protein